MAQRFLILSVRSWFASFGGWRLVGWLVVNWSSLGRLHQMSASVISSVIFVESMLPFASSRVMISVPFSPQGLCRKFRSDQHFVVNGFGYKADGE